MWVVYGGVGVSKSRTGVGGNEKGIIRFSLWALSQQLCQLSDKVNSVTV